MPCYNLGLDYKNCLQWQASLRCNQRAAELDPKNEAAWWNLGIAATALKDWTEARRAWTAYGIELEGTGGEVRTPPVTACVRLDPKNSGEVVWGTRIDPARTVVLNVPLPESGYRFRDIILNDGAPNGSRVDEDGTKVPVFDGLAIWRTSEYSTFGARLRIPNDNAEKRLMELCEEHQVGVEDWSTTRVVCARCSQGDLGPHDCAAKALEDGSRRFGFGAKSLEDLNGVLEQWTAENPTAEIGRPQLLVSARPV